MKLKTLRKKIRRLEVRLRDGPKKLARLKRKLEAALAADARKAEKKAAARAVARQTVKSSTPTPTEKHRWEAKSLMKPASARKSRASKKVKRKLNLSPERRAQLAAAMKARWAAKRAAVEASPQTASINQDFTIGQIPQTDATTRQVDDPFSPSI